MQRGVLQIISGNNFLHREWRAALFIFIIGVSYFSAFCQPEVRVSIFLALSIVAVMVTLLHVNEDRLRMILLFAFIIRMALAFLQAYGFIDLIGDRPADSFAFEAFGWQIAQAWLAGEPAGAVHYGYYYYSSLIGMVYYVFGRAPLVIQFINILFSLLIIYFVYELTLIMSRSKRASLISSLITALFPTLIYFSVLIFREIILIFFIILSFYFFLRWLYTANYNYILGSFISSLAMAFFHGAMLLVNWIQYLFYIFYNSKEQKFKFDFKQFIYILLIILLLSVILSEGIIQYKIPNNLVDLASLETFQKNVGDRKVSRTHYLDGFIPESYLDIIWHTPVRAFYFIFTPFPSMINQTRDLLGFFEVIFYLFLIIYGISGTKKLYSVNKIAAISKAIIICSIIFVFSWGTVNYGTAWRHKAKIAPLLIVSASVGMTLSKRWDGLLPHIDNDHEAEEKKNLAE